MANNITLETTAPDLTPQDFYVTVVRSVEEISTPYEVEIEFTCGLHGGLSPEAIRAMLDCTSRVSFGSMGLCKMGGIFREIEFLDIREDLTRARYRGILVPRFWLTQLTHRSRCFNEMTFPEIAESVLADHNLDFELRLDASYETIEYVVQYEESDFNFLSRWMESLGIFYYFEQEDGGEKIVLTDTNASLEPVTDSAECTYSRRDVAHMPNTIQAIRHIDRIRPEKVSVRDYNWREPRGIHSGEANIDADHGRGLQALYGLHFKTDDEGAKVAQRRAELWNVQRQTYYGQSANEDFMPGFKFTLQGAPLGELDIEYLITRVEQSAEHGQEGTDSASYVNSFEAIPATVPFRPPLRAPWPRIDGIMHAIIDAESVSSAAPIDDEGRYRVVFPYDIYGAYGGKATRWVRKAEPYSGTDYGMHFTLHCGAEVAIAHVGGDPDRPMIIGSAPSGATRSPLTRSHATRSAIRTRSGILFDFEDDA